MITTLHLTLAEYDHMVKVGAFELIPRKIELIRGELAEMNPAGPIHDDLVTYLTNWSVRNVDPEETLITSQTGLDLPSMESRPEPDLMWIRASRYRDRHPQAEDVQLTIEVAYSSLAYDLETKRRLYAEAGIREYWIVDSLASCIHVHREPRGDDFQNRFVRTIEHTLSPLFRANAVLNLRDLFGG
ncbi:MAG: Uma2 family endonuclease [Planctomycetaceae bacterium]|nr:Uma2 family endonuclease [Planctomycetaceae bacterium]